MIDRINARRLALFSSALLLFFAIRTTFAQDESQALVADATEAQSWVTFDHLLDEGVDVKAAQPDGMTALHWAVNHGNESAAARLLAAGCDANAKTRYEVTPLAIAATLGQPNVVEALLDGGAEVNANLPGKVTPLLLAARTGDADSIRLLVEHKAELEATERKGQTALMWAAAEGNVEAVDVLIKAGAKVNNANEIGFTAMMFAAREGHIEVVNRLLEAGVDPNATMEPKSSFKRVPRKGTTALTLAVESGHFELAMFLIDRGCDPNDQRNGYTALHMVSWVRKPNRGEEPDGDPAPRGSGKLTSLQFVREIVEAGVDVNMQLEKGKSGKAILNNKGATPFLFAARRADLPLMKLLVELGADPTITNVDGANAVMACAGVGVRAVGEEAGLEPEVLESLEFLIAQGLDVNAVDDNKETAMHGAAYRCFPQVIEFLAKHGAKSSVWNHKNKYGWTPIKIGQGYRPGSFKPSPETVAALEAAMTD